MPDYMVRVEIYKADGEDYEGLHKALEILGMRRSVPGAKGLLKMPDGTYFGESILTTDQLMEKILETAKVFSHPYDPAVFVSQSAGWHAFLKPA